MCKLLKVIPIQFLPVRSLSSKPLRVLCPSALPEWYLFPRGHSASITLLSPSPIFSQPDFSICSIVEVYLRNRGLNQSPYPPIEPWDASEKIYFIEQLLSFGFFVTFLTQMREITLYVFTYKVKSLGPGRKKLMFAIKTPPFCEVVGNIKCGRRRSSILIVNETDCFYFHGGGHTVWAWLHNHIAAQKITVGKDELDIVSMILEFGP